MVVEINPEQQTENGSFKLVKPASLHSCITDKVQQLHGDFGVAAVRAGFSAKYCNEKTRIAIIRARHGPHKLVASSLPFIKAIENNPATVNSLYTGATIRQCLKFLVKYQESKLQELCADLKTNEEKAAMRNSLLNFKSIEDMT